MAPERQTIAHYQILELLGSGTYATVYKARDLRLNRIVALKILKPLLITDPEALERFLREASLAGTLYHQRLAVVLDAGQSQGRYFLAMRYVDGLNLAQLLHQHGPLSWHETLRLSRQIAEALDFLHQQNLVHRDLKPQNILLEKGRDVVLADFGLAKALDTSGLSTKSAVLIGTPAYIPPEIWHGQPATPATDQYALACIVTEMITGRTLYEGPSTPAIMAKHLGPPPLPASWPDDVPPGLTQVLQKALDQDPKQRFPSVTAFVNALEALNQRPQPQPATARATTHPHTTKAPTTTISPPPRPPESTAPPSSPSQATTKHKSRLARNILWTAGSVVVILLFLFLASPGGGLPRLQNDTLTRDLQPITITNTEQVHELARWGKGNISQVGWAPNGRQLAVASTLGVYLYDPHTGGEIRLLKHPNWVRSIAFAPEGARLVSGSADGTVRLWGAP